jgi:CHAD domain-containing protein
VCSSDLGWLRVPASRAERIRLKKVRTFNGLVHAVLGECSRHLLLNVSQIASEQGSDSDHVHQARVALRRLRTALGLFGSVDAAAYSTVLPDWSEPAATLGTALSSNRDRDVMMASLWPRLRAAGAPLVELPEASAVQPPEWVVRQTQVQTWLLELIRFELQPRSVAVVDGDVKLDVETDPAAPAVIAAPAEADWSVVLPVLRKWHKQCVRGAREFAGLRLEQRHDLRKKMKRLRYGLEFIENECSKKQWKQFMPQLALSLDALGVFNDYHVALEQYQALALTDARAWFAVGFIQGQLLKTEKRVLKALAKFIEAKAPWPKVASSKLAELKAVPLAANDSAGAPLADA